MCNVLKYPKHSGNNDIF